MADSRGGGEVRSSSGGGVEREDTWRGQGAYQDGLGRGERLVQLHQMVPGASESIASIQMVQLKKRVGGW